MPIYKMRGVNQRTNRRKGFQCEANSPEEAFRMGQNNGIDVDTTTIEIIPEEPATEAQIEFAKNLGLNFSPDITKEQMSILLDINSGGDSRRPTYKQLRLARRIGIQNSDRLTRGMLSVKIDEKLEQIGGFEKTIFMRIHDFFEDHFRQKKQRFYSDNIRR